MTAVDLLSLNAFRLHFFLFSCSCRWSRSFTIASSVKTRSRAIRCMIFLRFFAFFLTSLQCIATSRRFKPIMASRVIAVIVLFFISFLATANGQFCGRSQVANSLSIGSEYAMRGQWPWLVPLLKKDRNKYFCGSTIVGQNHLLTGKF
jgi:hypothetical protein